MGKLVTGRLSDLTDDAPDKAEAELIIHEGKRFKRILALVSQKIYERFKDLLSAFRYFDTDHTMSLSLNEFA